MLGTGQGNPMSCWGQQRFFIDKLWCRRCHEETRVLSLSAFVSQSPPFPLSCSCLILRYIRFQRLWEMDWDLKDNIILQVLKMGSWLWERLYITKSASILGSRESTGAGGGMKRNTLRLSEPLKSFNWNSSSRVLQNAIRKQNRREPGVAISMLVKLRVLYSVLCCQMLPVK